MDWKVGAFMWAAWLPALLLGWNLSKIVIQALSASTYKKRYINLLLWVLLPVAGVAVWGARFGIFLLASMFPDRLEQAFAGLWSTGGVLVVSFALQFFLFGRRAWDKFVSSG